MLPTIWRIRATLSAKSAMTREFRLAVTDPSRLTSGRTVSIAVAGSTLLSLMISVTKLLGLAARRPTRPAVVAAVATGWMRSAPRAAGTATRPFARRVERNTSKYSERDSGRCVTTETLPCTVGSMMKVRPVTRAASSMKARMSASRRFSTYCEAAGTTGAETSASARAMRKLFIVLPSLGATRFARPAPLQHSLRRREIGWRSPVPGRRT